MTEEFTAAAVLAAYQRALEHERPLIVREMRRAAERHLATVTSGYAEGPTGNLRRRVLLRERNAFSFQVLATAPHVGLFERGTRPRFGRGGRARGRGSRSAGRLAARGVSPARGPIFIPAAIRERAAAGRAITALLQRRVEV